MVDRFNVTPRVGTAVLLNASGSAVLRGGFGLFYERTPSAAGTFDTFESALDTRFASDGVTPLGPAVRFAHRTAPDLETPRSRTWDLAYDHRLNPMWSLHFGVIDREGRHELILDPVQTASSAELRLSSTGRSSYREAEAGIHFTHGPGFDLNVSYARSAARGDLNAFTNYFDTVLWPVVGANAYGPSAADAPHRLFARGRAMPNPRWLLLGIADWRSGLPYSAVNETLDFVGPRNQLALSDLCASGAWRRASLQDLQAAALDRRPRLQRAERVPADRRAGQHRLAALRVVLQLRVPPVPPAGPLRALVHGRETAKAKS